MTDRPRRSVLYMPGSNSRALAKARSLDADVLILDLEDAVAPDAKTEARRLVAEALAEGGYGHRETLVRINAPGTAWAEDDIRMVAASSANGLLIPKVESPDTVRAVEAALTGTGVALWCMIETPLGVLRAAEIAAASSRLAGFVMGTSDLVKDLRARHTPGREAVLTALSLTVLAARAYGLAVIDGVHLDLDDAEGFDAACRQGVTLGFDGKTLIHPKTIDAANRHFAPSEAEIAWSHRIIAAFEAAKAEGKGVVVVDGKLVEELHVIGARRIVELAETIGAR